MHADAAVTLRSRACQAASQGPEGQSSHWCLSSSPTSMHACVYIIYAHASACTHACVARTCAACEHSLHTSCIFLPEQQPASRAPPAPRSPAFPAASPAPARSTGALRPGTAGGFALCHTRCAGGTPTPVSGPRSLGQVVSRCHTREAAVGASTRKAPPDARLRQPGR